MSWNLKQQWALTQGMLGARQKTLLPSLSAMGRNTYLGENDFFKMIALAMLLHAVILGVAALWPKDRVTDIPVRALSFKIGAGTRIAPPLQVGSPVAPQPITMTPSRPASGWRAAPAPAKPRPQPQPVKPAKIVPVAPLQRQAPAENPQPLQAPAPRPATSGSALPDTSILTSQVAIAPTPQRFIREMPGQQAQPGGAPSAAETAQIARARYEQEISAWILRHYPQNIPPGQRKLRPVVRMRIDRVGNLRYYAIEESSGVAAIDAAAIDMIRRANPMPTVPASYPAGNLIEFLIPIVFRVP